MLPAWAVVLTVAITAGATLAAVWLQGVLGRGEVRRRERREHDREGRELVVELAMMVRESNYQRYLMNTSEAMLAELQERQAALRPLEHRLLVWAAEHEESGMPTRSRELIAAVDGTIFSAAFVVREMLQGRPPTEQTLERARVDDKKASELADQFLAALGAN